jgi:hypothetical protein
MWLSLIIAQRTIEWRPTPSVTLWVNATTPATDGAPAAD